MSLMVLLPRIKLERQGVARKKVAIGAAIGLTVGAVAGVLLAPKAGKESRADIVKTIHELPDKAKELSDNAHKMLAEATGKISEETHEIMCGEKGALPGSDYNERSKENEDILKALWHEGIKAHKVF